MIFFGKNRGDATDREQRETGCRGDVLDVVHRRSRPHWDGNEQTGGGKTPVPRPCDECDAPARRENPDDRKRKDDVMPRGECCVGNRNGAPRLGTRQHRDRVSDQRKYRAVDVDESANTVRLPVGIEPDF